MTFHVMGEQFKSHFVALISLTIAIIALTYNTWREEITEKNRNLRLSAFEVLKNLGELQIVVNYGHYQSDNTMGNPIIGWGHIALVSDLGELLPPPIPEKIHTLTRVWGENWEKIRTDEVAVDLISDEIDASREVVLNELKSLK